jgi:hypothetical protein
MSSTARCVAAGSVGAASFIQLEWFAFVLVGGFEIRILDPLCRGV